MTDVPYGPVPLFRDLLDLVDQRVLVMDPTLASVRDTVRLLSLPKGHTQEHRAIVVLNRLGVPGGLTRRQVEEALKMKVDIAIPDLPRQVGNAATMGEPAINNCGALRTCILEIARKAASTRILDSAPGVLSSMGEGNRKRWRLFRRRS